MLIPLHNNVVFRCKRYLKDRIMAKLIITQVKSGIGSTKRQKATLAALGLKKLNQTVEHKASPEIIGMVNKMKHLLKVEEVN
ncbi:MAG: 50S ribosomal protein L30 [Chlorobi bacterium]|nr:50S ribosomal protein L30 [Chlorobiota bacterium]